MINHVSQVLVNRGETLPRVQKRRTKRNELILAVAAQSFALHGPDAVRLEDIAERADIARNTLYTHFPSKDALLVAVAGPAQLAIEQGLRGVSANEPRSVAQAILQVWASSWCSHRDAMRVVHALGANPPKPLLVTRRQIVARLNELFVIVERAGHLRGSAEWATLLLWRLGVPLLESYSTLDPTGTIFIECVALLLVK